MYSSSLHKTVHPGVTGLMVRGIMMGIRLTEKLI